ncbi:TetR/AcrR family transcriptional regulator [Glaciibacter psychrotolerans]|uniref:AcrR family transcriptional regulator n=1 Tax=Glaciibacter psychrotolerans TaxID=670054 RepID=A0A7Z0EFW0_9MICO|nr:TetR/AcrR family transcriptional regulator [Leifsonia psychrotolerans]NYJ20470.1 AcrR family transcriptional regulator [Leifsonia psychrotolerans]
MAIMPAKAKIDRTDQSSDRRNQILAIAARLFASHGYAATTVRDIADEAGILSGSLYHHFSSKEAIFQEILRSFMTGLLEQIEEIAAEGRGPRETLDGLIRTAFRVMEEQSDAVGLYQNESTILQSQVGFEFLSEGSARIEHFWREQIEAGQAQGVFRDSFDSAIVYRFVRDAVWSTVRWYRPNGRYTAETLTQNFLDLFHSGVLAEES